jgi:2-dehydro-3-deoxyphosphogluconate aldolase/(4S)-4-hydroxy-2-oxoglutarate aldolase
MEYYIYGAPLLVAAHQVYAGMRSGARRSRGTVAALVVGAGTVLSPEDARRAVTPTEMLMAHRAGGPDAIRAILGPMPFLRPVPTNGVTGDNAAAYLKAGAYAIAFVGALFTPQDLEGGRFDRIEERARSLRGIVERVSLPA